jgi:hypothetical protein
MFIGVDFMIFITGAESVAGRLDCLEVMRDGGWPVSTTSTAFQSSILGPTHSLRPPDMIRSKETLV